MKGLIELERRCLTLREEVERLDEKQEVLAYLMVSKRDMQKEAPEKYQEKIFEEFKELEEQRAKVALALVQKKHMLFEWEVHGPEATTVRLLVLAHRPWSSRQTKQRLLPSEWRKRCSGKGEGKRLVEH